VAGRRRTYANPVTYLLLTTGVSVLMWNLLGDPFAGDRAASMRKSAAAIMKHASQSDQARWLALNNTMLAYVTQVTFALCLILVIVLGLVFRKSGRNVAETAVFVLFTTGQVYLYASLAGLFCYWATHSYRVNVAVNMVAFPVVYAPAAWGFFGARPATVFKMVLAMGVAFVAFSVVELALIRALVAAHF
jgi:hypothetical protein